MSQNYKPLISIIMPCYNAASYVEEAVRCVMGQTYPNVELIVVDDGSSDGSVEIVTRLAKEFEGRIHHLFQDHSGPYPARNLGLKHACGEFVAFLDADDWWDKTFIEKLYAALVENPEATLAYCGWQNVGLEGGRGQPYVPPDYLQEDFFVRLLKNCPFPIHAVLTRKDTIDAVRGFSTFCFTSMDYDLWLKIAAHCRNWVRVEEVLAFYRWHDQGQISATKWRQILDAIQVRQRFVEQNPAHFQHLEQRTIKCIQGAPLLQAAYQTLWHRDLSSAHILFRHVWKNGTWKPKDLKYLLPALLPETIFILLINLKEKIQKTPQT